MRGGKDGDEESGKGGFASTFVGLNSRSCPGPVIIKATAWVLGAQSSVW